MKKSFILLFTALTLASTTGCKGQTAEREDYARDSCIVQRVAREAEQAIIVVGDIEYQKTLRRLEEIIQQKDSMKQIPLYTEANYYRFSGMPSQYQGRIDLRIPIIPAVHPELRSTSFYPNY